MRKVVFLVAIIALTIFASRCNQAHAYSITSADTVVSAYITGEVITPSPTPIATPSGTLTPTPPLSPTPSPSVSPTPTPAYGGRFSLWGYTSPEAKVSVTNPGMYADTTADKGGYFEFRSFFSQQIVEDICLTAQDQAGRVTMPVCIPPIPSNENQSIGPVIMPPTISLNSDSFYTGDTVVVSGQTTPQTDVQLSLFTDESKTKLGSVRDSKPIAYRILMALEAARAWLSPVRPSYASTQPKQAAKVDRLGNFSVVVPSSDATYYRTFAQTIRNKDYSLKSITLNFDIFPGWFLIMKLLIGFFSGLKARFAEIVILSQVILIAYLLIRHFLQPHSIARMRSLAIMEHPLPVFTEHELVIREHEQRLDNLVRQKEALNQILGR